MPSVSRVIVNTERHTGAVEVFNNPSSNQIASYAAGTGFDSVKTHAAGASAVPYEATTGHYVIKPKLFPQVACHVILEDNKAQVSNQSPFGELHVVFGDTSFTIDNQHKADLQVKHTPPASFPVSEHKLPTFSGADTVKKGDKHTFKREGNYTISSTVVSSPAHFCFLDFVDGKIYVANGNPAGEITITLEA